MKRSSRFDGLRVGSFGVAACLLFALSGDKAFLAPLSGIDPLQILDLQVRPNVIVVLDSSGSMRQSPAGTSFNTPSQGGLVGDDHESKMWQAKDVIRTIVTNNQDKVNFMFGQYTQDAASLGPETRPTFIYKSSNAAAAAISIPAFGTAGLRRDTTQDLFTNAAGGTDYYLESNTFYNSVTVNVQSSGDCAIICSTAAGSKADPALVTVQMVKNAAGSTAGMPAAATFSFQGVRWNLANDPDDSCNGFQARVSLAACTNNSQLPAFNPYIANEVLTETTGANAGDILKTSTPTYYNPSTDTIASISGFPGGIRSSGRTPIAKSLNDIKGQFDTVIKPSLKTGQRTFVVFVTDGDDTCGGYRQAAYSAQTLYNAAATDVREIVPTFLVAFGTGASVTEANQIAYGGSGMTAVPNDGTAWTRDATATEVTNCTTCRGAFTAANRADLEAAIQSAISQGVSTGTFSDQQSITESIFELGSVVSPQLTPPVDPLDPDTRYNATIPVLLQSTFEMPDFKGHLNAFRNLAGTSLQIWDAGQKLFDQVVANGTATCPSAGCTFAELHAGATPDTIRTSSAKIKRRIFTTTRNGVYLGGTDAQNVSSLKAGTTPSEQVALWPPDSAVDPAKQGSSYPSGPLDTAMGITAMATARLNALGACVVTSGGTLDPECSRTGYVQKEAREIILAFTAGAKVVLGPDGKPNRTAAGLLQYRGRSWLLAEGTLSAPVIVAPPPEAKPGIFVNEYTDYRDGTWPIAKPAKNLLANGFGLRNPDKDGRPTSKADNALKPVMTVVYFGANDMLHAFRAGPCPATASGSCGVETGGEELWGFVPYDLLGNLALRMQPQGRVGHTYMIASPPRFADVFVPGAHTFEGQSRSGVWRLLLFFGRGIAGKYYTALDVTAPGAFTKAALATAPPIAVWSRGNPDTQDGTTGGTKNNTFSAAAGLADYDAYRGMGQTWSVPAVARVDFTKNTTTRRARGVDFVAYVGSGFGSSTEGTRFYALDALSGDVIASTDVGDRTDGTEVFPDNAIVASPAVFNPDQLVAGGSGHPASSLATRVYVGDIHGRLWKFLPATANATPPLPKILVKDFGAQQPLGNPVALLNYDSAGGNKPHIYLETGNDNRVAQPPSLTPPFMMVGLRDEAGDADVSSPQNPTVLFDLAFPNNPGPGFRGTVQPATAFNEQGNGRVFFAGTQFNLPGANCASSFDSILFALTGATGSASYDLNSGNDLSVTLTNQRITAVQVSKGYLVVDTGLGAENPPPPPKPPEATGATASNSVFQLASFKGTPGFLPNSPVCRGY